MLLFGTAGLKCANTIANRHRAEEVRSFVALPASGGDGEHPPRFPLNSVDAGVVDTAASQLFNPPGAFLPHHPATLPRILERMDQSLDHRAFRSRLG